MLVEFRIKNFRSFRDEQVLSLVASNDTVLAGNCATEGKLRLLKAVGIYGPNASGKSNLIKAIDIMRKIVLNSANYKPGRKLSIQPFLLDDESQKKPSFFEVTFYHEGTRYQYGFTATSERIHEEWLLAYPEGQLRESPQRWFERKLNRDDWKFSTTYLRGEKNKIKEKTRNNALFLSVAAQWNNKQLTTVYEWFEKILHVVPAKETLRPVTAKMLLDVKKEEQIEGSLYKFVIKVLQEADLGIHDVNIKALKLDRDKTKLPEFIPIELRERFYKNVEKEPPLKVEMLHFNKVTNKEIAFPLEEESDGTQRLFQLLGPWLETVSHGYTVFFDELELSLHPLLTHNLVQFIQEAKYKSPPQLIFATHDTTLLDPDLFRRDQIWFTEKDKSGSTLLSSMWDYKEGKPRKGEAMQKGYLAGRYGAIPILEAFDISNG